MKIAGAIGLFLLICAISAWLYLASIPVVVHQVAPELNQTLMIFAGLLALAVVWWFASGRNWAFAVIGWLVLAVPFSAHAIWQGKTSLADYRGANLPSQMAVENFRETPIYWDDFDGPVGMTIELDLVHPPGLDGFVFTPQIRMAPAYDIAAENLESSRTFSGGYFKDWHIGEDLENLVILKPVLFQGIYDDNPPDHDIDWFDASGRTRLVYRLHPGTVDQLPSQDKICLVNPSFGLPNCAPDEGAEAGCVSKNTRKVTEVIYNIGTDLNALWTASGGTFRNADIGGLITEALREHSVLQGDSAAWAALQQRFEPAGLAAAGYHLCPAGKESHSIGKVCYCRL